MRNAVLCLDSQTVSDTYTIALMAYALSLWDPESRQRRNIMDRLDALATHNGDKAYFPSSRQLLTSPPFPHRGHDLLGESSHLPHR